MEKAAMEAWKVRDIIIGIVLLLVGGATLLHTMGVFRFDEDMAVWAGVIGLVALGVAVMIVYLFKPESLWLMIISFCLFFLAATLYISYFTGDEKLVAVALLLLTSLAFLLVFIRDRRLWWTLLVTWTSFGLAIASFIESNSYQMSIFRGIQIDSDAQKLVFLCCVALGFFFVWLADPRRLWWSLMTSGLTFAVCSAAGAHALGYSEEMGAVFLFLVAGVVFFLLWLIRNEENGLSWAIYPAAALLPFSAFLYTVLFWRGQKQIILSIIFIVLGLLFIFGSTIFRRRPDRHQIFPPERRSDFSAVNKHKVGAPFSVGEPTAKTMTAPVSTGTPTGGAAEEPPIFEEVKGEPAGPPEEEKKP
jgi:hypothetical protein